MRLAIALILYACAHAAGAQQIVTLETRPGVTQSILLERVPEKPLAVALLFPGSGGRIRLRSEDGEIRFGGGNFLVRSRMEFTQRGVAAVVLDAPSDQQPSGMDDNFRLGRPHAEDISAVITEIRKRFPGLPVFLVGTSRGTVSAASLGQRLPEAVAGVVLTATLFVGGRRFGQQGLSGFDFAAIKPPLLLVHHRDDGCEYTPYRAASRLAERYPLVSVTGGLPAKSTPCEAYSEHGFLGREAETVEAIVNWMLKRPYAAEIN
jgi:pimeloyl-ACP methyl ester carboxylesterase